MRILKNLKKKMDELRNELSFYGQIYWAHIESINPSEDKPLRVKRMIMNEKVELDCYATKKLIDDYTRGELKVGEPIVICFINNDPSQPLAIAKVYRSSVP
ncbi:MAG: hypothetical protein H3Z50_00180 [archaeon]|nr:hypothetical protein [archaeon]MCP8305889.1 hypothetical protein [archaeon]